MNTSTCPGCGVILPITGYPASNPYGVLSPECRQKFDEILVKEQALFTYPAVHRLIIDAYSVQHPRHATLQKELNISPRLQAASVQSIAIHLIALYCALELKMQLTHITSVMDTILTTMNQLNATFPELEPPHTLGKIRVTDIHTKFFAQETFTLLEYEQLACEWVTAAWNAWQQHHITVKKWYEQYTKKV